MSKTAGSQRMNKRGQGRFIKINRSKRPPLADIDGYAEGIVRRVEKVLAATGAARVIMVGHSMGGLASRADLRRHGSDRVARLIRPGSPHHGSGIAHLGPGRSPPIKGARVDLSSPAPIRHVS